MATTGDNRLRVVREPAAPGRNGQAGTDFEDAVARAREHVRRRRRALGASMRGRGHRVGPGTSPRILTPPPS